MLTNMLRRIFGDGPRMYDAWPQMVESPIITVWAWSPLVTSGVELNAAHIHPTLARGGASNARALLPGLLALHIRRRDFLSHCKHLARWSSQWSPFNMCPEVLETFDPPPGGSDGKYTYEMLAYYLHHCYPDIP
jgi:hypothetical protein